MTDQSSARFHCSGDAQRVTDAAEALTSLRPGPRPRSAPGPSSLNFDARLGVTCVARKDELGEVIPFNDQRKS
jgi:hypothetical protein